jgi:hypothetical protein
VGNAAAGASAEARAALRIDAMLDVGDDSSSNNDSITNDATFGSIDFARIPLEDKRKPDLKWALQQALEYRRVIEFVAAHLARGHRVLVYGGSGGNRAPAVCLAVLLRCCDEAGAIDPSAVAGANESDGSSGGDKDNDDGSHHSEDAAKVDDDDDDGWDPRNCVVDPNKNRVNLVTSWITSVHPRACLSRAYLKQINRFFNS